jgi:hypothetical protein
MVEKIRCSVISDRLCVEKHTSMGPHYIYVAGKIESGILHIPKEHLMRDDFNESEIDQIYKEVANNPSVEIY